MPRLSPLGISIAIALAAVTAPLRADPVEEKNVLSGKTKLQSDKGYIYLYAPQRLFGTFLRVPDDDTSTKYRQDWEQGFIEAQKRYQNQLRRWEADVKVAAQVKKKPPEKPAEPTRDTFAIDPIELRDAVSFGPMFIYAKSETRFSYLSAVKPGTYIWYGVVLGQPGLPASGQCACMGTIRFEVKPGVVTDLGNFLQASSQPTRTHDVGHMLMWQNADEKAAKTGKPAESFVSPLPALVFGLPDSLRSWPSVQVEAHASGKLNNYYGVSISRMPPIPGVLAYRRDTVVDVRANTEVPDPAIVTQAKIKK